jgi:hypothetical protein
MKFLWKKLAQMHAENQEALQNNQAVLEAAEQEAQVVEEISCRATAQASKLRERDAHNHYSESLTLSMRGKLA